MCVALTLGNAGPLPFLGADFFCRDVPQNIRIKISILRRTMNDDEFSEWNGELFFSPSSNTSRARTQINKISRLFTDENQK